MDIDVEILIQFNDAFNGIGLLLNCQFRDYKIIGFETSFSESSTLDELDFSDLTINNFARQFECNSKLSLKAVFHKNLRSYGYGMELFLIGSKKSLWKEAS